MSAGYAFVTLPDRVNVRRRPAAVHDRRVEGAFWGTLSLTWLAEQPIHVGSGFKGLLDDKVIRRAVHVHGRPGIPGASMKGVLRARYEAITRSCIPGGPPKPSWTVRSQTYQLTKAKARLTEDVRRREVFRSHKGSLELCPACALFGQMSYRSRLTLTDLVWVDPDCAPAVVQIPKQFGPNLHHIGPFRANVGPSRRDDPYAFEVYGLHGRKFAVGRGPRSDNPAMEDVEALPAGSHLRGELRLFNVLPEELGGLLIALGLRPSGGALKVGGGKAQGLGRMRPESVTVRLFDAGGGEIQRDDEAWSDAFERSDDRFDTGVRELVDIHRGDC